VNAAEPALREAVELVNKMVEGLGQQQRIGDRLILVVRPQEAVAAVQAFAQAAGDFFAAVADYNRAQFRLYRALGHPAQCLAGAMPAVAAQPPVVVPEEKPAQPPAIPVVPQVEEVRPPAGVAPERPPSVEVVPVKPAVQRADPV